MHAFLNVQVDERASDLYEFFSFCREVEPAFTLSLPVMMLLYPVGCELCDK